MSAYVTSRTLARQSAAVRKAPLEMVPQTTNPRRFMQWLTIVVWLFVLLATGFVGTLALLGLIFGIQF